MPAGTLLYAQSGGVTAVINATATAEIKAARARSVKVLAARNGILGALREELIDTSRESAAAIRALAHTPGGAFGSCRLKLKSLDEDRAKYARLIEVFRAHDVRWFLYNGGNDSADTAWKVSQLADEFGYPLTCIGVPKTVDNDLAVTDCCPGFGSAAKYTAVSVREAALDVAAMAETSTKVFVYEAMGRHAGWLAAAAGLAGKTADDAPHLRTAGLVTLGSRIVDLRAAFPEVAINAEEDEGFFSPANFYVSDNFRGLLTGTTDDDTITVLFGGLGCGA